LAIRFFDAIPRNLTHNRNKSEGMKQADSKVALDIRKTPGVCGGGACVGRTRIPVWLLIAYLNDGD
jgi:hypothetical protein